MIPQVIIVIVTLLGYMGAANYEGGYDSLPEKAVGSGFGINASGEDGSGQNLTYGGVPEKAVGSGLGLNASGEHGSGQNLTYGGVPEKAVGSGLGVNASGEHGAGQNYSPKPYQFHYFATDGQGNSHYRNEQSDQSGAVRGTYGYRDAKGLYRVVQYVADARGFRANITTNEPGTGGKENPASVNIIRKYAENPPLGIQYRSTECGRVDGYIDGQPIYRACSYTRTEYSRDRPHSTGPSPSVRTLMPGMKKSMCNSENVVECVIGVGSG